eukprot:GEMP01025631.1.p1 GENE.GEMP01025631.1~~GEMP01025631.1.p1  ORF type:complete len:589 (+),score=98.63 GEMP01025631.1:192-1958(+)
MPKTVEDWALEFARWLEPRWAEFWLKFNVSGVLSRYDFEGFLQMHNFSDDERSVFEQLDVDGKGYLTTRNMISFRNNVQAAQIHGNVSAADFKIMLKRAHQTLFRAFRVMDPKNKGYISRADYCKECQTIGFQHSKSVWNELSKDGNTIELGAIEPQAAQAFNTFARCIFAKYRTLSECWKWTINSSKNPRIGMSEFVRAARSLNVNESTSKLLFECLQQNKAVHEDVFMDVMRHWDEDGIYKIRVPDKFRSERFDLVSTLTPVTAGTAEEFVTWARERWAKIELIFRRSAEVTRFGFEEHLRLLGYPYDEKAAGSLLVGDERTTISLRDYQRYKAQIKRSRDVAAYTKSDFYTLVRRRYRSLIGAWRHCLDPMNDGKIGLRPFCKHCHDFGFKGDVKILWKLLMAKSRTPGFVDLAGFDPASINVEKGTGVSFDTFHKYCAEQGFKGSARKVYRALDYKNENFLTREGLDFLRHWDPTLPSLHKNARVVLKVPRRFGSMDALGGEDVFPPEGEEKAAADELFTFQVVLGPAEYAEFLRKKANARMIDGSSHVPREVRPIGLMVHAQLGGRQMIPRQGGSLEGLLALT